MNKNFTISWNQRLGTMISSMGGVALLIDSHIRAQGEKMGQIVTKCIMSQNKNQLLIYSGIF